MAWLSLAILCSSLFLDKPFKLPKEQASPGCNAPFSLSIAFRRSVCVHAVSVQATHTTEQERGGEAGKRRKEGEREGKEAYLLEAAFSFFCFASEDK